MVYQPFLTAGEGIKAGKKIGYQTSGFAGGFSAIGDGMKRAKIFSKEFSLLWNIMMPLESNVVTTEEAAFMYPFDLNKQEDIEALFDLYVKEYFLNLSKDKQDETLQAIDHILKAENDLMNDFFEYEFGFAPQEPSNKKKFMEEVKAILISYLSLQDRG